MPADLLRLTTCPQPYACHAPRATRHAPRATRHALLSSQERLKTIFNELISEFRKTVTLLTGFRVDMVGETRQYEVRPSMALKGDVLKFRCSKEGDMELLPTEFAARLSPQIETYLQARPNPPFSSITILSYTPT